MSILGTFILMSPVYLLWMMLFLKVKEKELKISLLIMMIILSILPFVAETDEDVSNFEYYFIDGNDWSTMND